MQNKPLGITRWLVGHQTLRLPRGINAKAIVLTPSII